jgi:NTE family protein
MIARITASLAACAMLLAASPAFCQQTPVKLKLVYTAKHGGLRIPVAPASTTMPKLGLALAGGGAKAAASLGVLKVMEREGIPVSFLAGTSMGAGVGGLFAAGYSPDEIERIFLANDWNNVFTDKPPRAFLTQQQKEAGGRHLLEFTVVEGGFTAPTGLTGGQRLMNLLGAKTLAASFEADLNFDKLPVPFRAIATDIETGDTVVLGGGLLHEAMRASMAIPLVFQPVEINGRLLVDGGLVNNLPVDVVRDMGATVVFAVDASAKLEKKERLTSLIEIMSQSISLQVRRESERQAALADLVITPDTSDYSFTDFPAVSDIIKKGEEAARDAVPRIREIMLKKKTAPRGTERFRVTSLVVRGNAHVSEATLRFAMAPALFPHESTVDDLLFVLGDVYRLGYFFDVSLDLEREGEGTRAVLTVEENPVVQDIEISGNTLVSTGDVLTALSWQYGEPLNVIRLSSDLDRIVEQCRSRGFLLTRVERAGMKPDGRTLELVLYEGRVDSIRITGQQTTRESLIRQETRTRTGQPLNFDVAANDIQHLYALDYFESLSVDMLKSPQGGIDLTVKVREKPTTRIRLGIRYDLGDRFTGLTDLIVDNVSGRGIKLFLNTRYGNYADVAAGYHSPVIINTNASFDHTLQAFYRERRYFVYENNHKVNELLVVKTGAELAFGYQWFRFGDTYLRYRYAADSTEEVVSVNPVRDAVHIGSLAFLTTVDTRDKNVFPDSGVLFKGSYELAQPEYGSSHRFAKASLYAQKHVPLSERHTLVLGGSAGIGNGAMPYDERFGIGGADYLISIPLSGYNRREFTGQNVLQVSAAYRWKIRDYQLKAVKAVYLQMSGQLANVWDDRKDMTLDDMKNGAGIGLHADTVIGPIRLDYGRGEQQRNIVYFSAGFDF